MSTTRWIESNRSNNNSPATSSSGGVGGDGHTHQSQTNSHGSVWAGKRDAKGWSREKFKGLIEGVKYDTPVGLFALIELETCDGDAYMTKGSGSPAHVFYEWDIRLKWKLTAREDGKVCTGQATVSRFNSKTALKDVEVKFKPDSHSQVVPTDFMASCRACVVPRIKDILDNYIYYLLDKLNNRSSASNTLNKPLANKTEWLKTNQTPMGDENEPPSSQSSGNIDLFAEREGAGGMRVGRDYQAKVPPMLSTEDRLTPQENAERALLVWAPTEKLTDEEIERYLLVSKDEYQYNGEQALGLLFWHRYDIDRSIEDLRNFTPHPEEWTMEDKVLFEQAFLFHGKAFDKIRQMLPDKSMSNLIRYYYKWKKYKSKRSVIDKQARILNQGGEDGMSAGYGGNHNNNNNNRHASNPGIRSFRPPAGNNSDGDDERPEETGAQVCSNCAVPCTEIHSSLCNTCYLFWKRTGGHRPLTGAFRRGDRHSMGLVRLRKEPPKGIYLSHDDLNTLASSTPQVENVTLKDLERKVLNEKCRVQVKRQEIEILKRNLKPDVIERAQKIMEEAGLTAAATTTGTTPSSI